MRANLRQLSSAPKCSVLLAFGVDRVYGSLEAVAQRHELSTPTTPFTLACHIDNDRGRAFWERHGYGIIPDPKLEIEDEIYYRMVR